MSAQADDFIEALQGQREISVTVKGRVTGRQITVPVWFILEGRSLYLLPVKGSRTQWIRNLLADPAVTIHSRWRRLSSQVRLIQDPRQVQEVADKFRAKYRPDQVARYYSAFDICVEVPLLAG